MSTKVVLLDLGNVLFRFNLNTFATKYLKKTPKSKIESFNSLILKFSDLGYSYEKGNISSFEFFTQLKEQTNYEGTFDEWSVIWNDIFTPIPEVIELAMQLSKKYPVNILSNINELHFNYLKECYPVVFMVFGKKFLSFEMHLRKPENQIFKETTKLCGVAPNEILFIDDIEENIVAAKNNGLNAYQFTSYKKLIEVLKEENI
ncbi:MAG: HAD family phosphatase [Elusimicrobiota bacterium]|jgi:putative hydrolase of the HAD superfamily|nr:HAD family phosphatase [Elusimicrobiota bacterium]